jgi:hypothetical protein
VTCELTIFGLGSHSATGEEWADDDNAGTSAEAQAFKRACSCFGLGRYLYHFSGVWVDLDERKRPKSIPRLFGWATPQGWRQGLRPGQEADTTLSNPAPIPVAEAKRLKNWLAFSEPFSALDPCVGDGVAFAHLVQNIACNRYGIEVDANRAEQAKALGIETLQADTMDVRCQPESVSLLYLNPTYDWEAGESNNQRLGSVFFGTYLSLAQGWRSSGFRHSAATAGEMREVVE